MNQAGVAAVDRTIQVVEGDVEFAKFAVHQCELGGRNTVVDRGGSAGSGWLIAIVLILAVLVGGYFLMQGTNASANKDDAIAGAAKDVGDAANKVGDAAQDAVKKLDDGK